MGLPGFYYFIFFMSILCVSNSWHSYKAVGGVQLHRNSAVVFIDFCLMSVLRSGLISSE